MKIIEIKKNIFDVDKKYYLAQCISADYDLGKGIAVEFNKRFHLKNNLKEIGNGNYPTCIRIGKVYNLVTKKKYWNKPTYESLTKSLELMKLDLENSPVHYLAMPKIASGLDRLSWGKVREIIQDMFKDTDIEILVCHL